MRRFRDAPRVGQRDIKGADRPGVGAGNGPVGRASASVHRRLQAGNTDISTSREAGTDKTATPTSPAPAPGGRAPSWINVAAPSRPQGQLLGPESPLGPRAPSTIVAAL